MTTLVVGATGATGRLLVEQLLDRGQPARVVVRAKDRLSGSVLRHPDLTVSEASLLDLTDAQLAEQVAGCDAIASCLGHNLTLKGVFGPPRRLVTDAVRRLSEAAIAARPERPVRFVLMSSAGVRNHDLVEPASFAQRAVVGLIRTLVPPHADNEQAAEWLRTQIGPDHARLAWSVVRPDSLIDEPAPTERELHPSPVRNPIFNSGKTSRANVAALMADLVTDDALWDEWRGRMPVVYNRGFGSED